MAQIRSVNVRVCVSNRRKLILCKSNEPESEVLSLRLGCCIYLIPINQTDANIWSLEVNANLLRCMQRLGICGPYVF